MNICFICDLHLPFDKSAIQYKALELAIKSIQHVSPDLIIFAGDASCDGDPSAYRYLIEKLSTRNIPLLHIPGNSDLRDAKNSKAVKAMASKCKNIFGKLTVFAINDSDGTVSKDQLELLETAPKGSIAFIHHPINELLEETKKLMTAWRARRPDVLLFHAHLHRFEKHGNDISLPALDPDKSVEGEPCILYFDTETEAYEKEHFPCPIPDDFTKYLGLSCFTLSDIRLATRYRLKYLELRPSALSFCREELLAGIEEWRSSGGEGLSVHLPDVTLKDGNPFADKSFELLLRLAKELGANRLTQHVPMVSVNNATEECLSNIAEFISAKLKANGIDSVIGIENMHMTKDEIPDGSRRFGYVPDECLKFAEILAQKCNNEVGINFDIGHARNNAPFSHKYQIGTWMSMLGDRFVGYHLHQVTSNSGKLENHMPINELYGHTISFASLFRMWGDGAVRKAPLILEMRPEGAYEISLNTFLK